MTSEETLI